MSSTRTETSSKQHSTEVGRGDRFRFGANWTRFLQLIDEGRIATAVESLRDMFGFRSLEGKRFLDVGSGSGLFSLAASRLGAEVTSFDFDPQSVACTRELKRRFNPDAPWTIEQGSVLDPDYLDGLGTFDLVYSWGVLHHTGSMWTALENVLRPVRDDGLLCIALYNDQGWKSKVWTQVKRVYCKGRLPGRAAVLGVFFPFFTLHGAAVDLISSKHPVERYRRHQRDRGMSLHLDWIDWLGGYPFEVASPTEVIDFYRARGWELARFKPCEDMGNNEFLLARNPRRHFDDLVARADVSPLPPADWARSREAHKSPRHAGEPG